MFGHTMLRINNSSNDSSVGASHNILVDKYKSGLADSRSISILYEQFQKEYLTEQIVKEYQAATINILANRAKLGVVSHKKIIRQSFRVYF